MLSKMSSILQPKNAVLLYDRKTRCRDVACVEGMLVQVRYSVGETCVAGLRVLVAWCIGRRDGSAVRVLQ